MSDVPAAEPRSGDTGSAGSWILPVVRGGLAIAAAIVITFSQNHSATFGLVVFGTWAVVSGAVVGALSLRAIADRGIRSLFTVNAVVTATAGLLALTLPGEIGTFVYLVSVWAAITGLIELLTGARARRRSASAREWIAAGAFTALLALVFALVPLDPVTAVGLLGGYLVVLGIYLVIAGFSAKWAAGDIRSASSASPPTSERADVTTQEPTP